jgi:hypothetical protein
MNTDTPLPDPAPDEPTGGFAPGENQEEPKKKPRRHILGLPPGYQFDPNAKPTLDDLSGIPVCFGDDELPRWPMTTEQPGGPSGG